MTTPEQRLPDQTLPEPREACFTLGTQRQFKLINEEYKDGTELIKMIIETRAKDVRLLRKVGLEPTRVIPFEQERIIRELGLWLFINHKAIYQVRPWQHTREGGIWFTRHKDTPKTVYGFLTNQGDWLRGKRKQFVLRTLKTTADKQISVMGHDGKILEYAPKVDPSPRFLQMDHGLHLDLMLTQRIYNNSKWLNPVVAKLTAVEPAQL